MDPTLQSYIEILIRLQCNEEWPICSNCTQHSDQCSFSTRSRPSGPPSNVTTLKPGEDLMDFGHPSRSSSLAIVTDTPKSALDSRLESVFSLVDLELLHNYETLTSHTLSGIPQMQTFMRVDVPRNLRPPSRALQERRPRFLHFAGREALRDCIGHCYDLATEHQQGQLRRTVHVRGVLRDVHNGHRAEEGRLPAVQR